MIDPLDALATAVAGRYRIERELGAGGAATVYLAHDLRHNRRVAIKLMRPAVAAALGAERFLREIEVTAGLQHPNIVPLFDSGQAGDLPWFVMPYVEGESLRARLRQEGALPVDDAIRILEQVADALAWAHERGIIHRDIKPDNVLLSGRHAFVTDFGVARALSLAATGQDQTTGDMPLGTPSYMAPEQVRADPAVDHRADLYALGAMGYELLAGSSPFAGGTPQERMAAHLRLQPAPLLERRPDAPPALAALIEQCLRKDPAERPASAAEVVEALRTRSGITAAAGAPPGPGRWRAGLAVAAILVALVAVGLLARRGTEAPAAGPDSTASGLAIFPFTVRGGADVQYLGEGVVSLLTTTLDGAGGMRAVDPRALLSLVNRRRDLTLTPANAARLAEELGARRFVLGDIVEAGSRLRITATLYDVTGAGTRIGRGDADGVPAATLDLVDSVATELLATSLAASHARTTSLADVTTASLPAMRAYLQGEQAFRLGRYREATDAFAAATSADPTFALAWFRQSIAAEWALQPGLAITASRRAVEHTARLGEHDRRLLEALLAFRQGDVERSEQMFQGIIAIWPHDVDALIQLGEIRFHWGPLLGRPIAASASAFERVLALEPDEPTSLVHLVRIAGAMGDTARIGPLVARFLQLNPEGERAIELQGLGASLNPDPTAWDVHLTRLRSASDVSLPQALIGVSIWSDALDHMADVIAEERRPSRSVPMRALGAIHAGYLATMRGRLVEAEAALQEAERLDPVLGLEHRAFLALLPFGETPADTLRALEARLARAPLAPTVGLGVRSAHFDIHDDLRGVIIPHLRGRLLARTGDLDGARRMARAVRAAAVDTGRLQTREALARSVEVEVALAAGRTDTALDHLDPLGAISDYESALFSPLLSFASERFRQAELLEAAGRRAEALARYRSFEQFSFHDRVFAAPAHLRLGELLEADGRTAEAGRHYARVLQLWPAPDPVLAPLRRAAEAGLARTAAGGDGRLPASSLNPS